MGRGRAKAKQTRIARELKYFTPAMDVSALQHELGADSRPDDDAADEAGRRSEDSERSTR